MDSHISRIIQKNNSFIDPEFDQSNLHTHPTIKTIWYVRHSFNRLSYPRMLARQGNNLCMYVPCIKHFLSKGANLTRLLLYMYKHDILKGYLQEKLHGHVHTCA